MPQTTSLVYRLLHDLPELDAAVEVVRAVWGEPAVALASPPLLRAYGLAGNPVIGALVGDEVVGVAIGFLAPGGGLHLHSHITGVLPAHQHRGVGYGLKQAQRRWCRAHGIDLAVWTFDPLLARNAHFNFRKLGATSRRLLPDFYGAMADDVNTGEASDRLEVRWLVDEDDAGAARARAIVHRVAVPGDHLDLRRRDPAAAAAARARVRDELVAAFDRGLEIVDFDRADGYLLAGER